MTGEGPRSLILHLNICEGEKKCWERQNTQQHAGNTSDGIKDKHVATKTVSISTERDLGGGLRWTLTLLTAAITLNQMFWY